MFAKTDNTEEFEFDRFLNALFHQLNVALKSTFKVVTSRHQIKLSNSGKQQKAKIMESKTVYILKILYRTSFHINYQRMNTIHYRTDLITTFLQDL